MKDKRKYKILNSDLKVQYTGTIKGSWFTLKEARRIVDYDKGEMIYEYSGGFTDRLWQVF